MYEMGRGLIIIHIPLNVNIIAVYASLYCVSESQNRLIRVYHLGVSFDLNR